MILSLAHITPLLVPSFWVVFAAGLAVGVLIGYRIGLNRHMGLEKTESNPKSESGQA